MQHIGGGLRGEGVNAYKGMSDSASPQTAKGQNESSGMFSIHLCPWKQDGLDQEVNSPNFGIAGARRVVYPAPTTSYRYHRMSTLQVQKLVKPLGPPLGW
jgi:hypothetical protein